MDKAFRAVLTVPHSAVTKDTAETKTGTRQGEKRSQMSVAVEILYIKDCPGYEPALVAVNEAIAHTRISAKVRSVEALDADTPGFAGSPTVRINGKDIDSKGAATDCCGGLNCRTYSYDGRLKNVPSTEMIESALRRERERPSTSSVLTPLFTITAAVSSVACCLPFGIAGVLGSIGLSFYLEKHRWIVLSIAILSLALQALQLYRQRERFGKASTSGKVLLGIAGAIVAAMILAPDQIALLFTKLN